MTGAALRDAVVGAGQVGEPVIDFELTADGSRIFGTFTGAHLGDFLAIVLDKTIISAPRIDGAITERGTISGSFTVDTANQLALQLRYGALPVPLKVVESRVVGPSLGQDSLTRSLRAGAIGMAVVVLFMILYYRLPGVVAVLAILTYGLITLALFKLIPVTLSLAGIAGFLLSTGSALDANILIFERLKEELRAGRSLNAALGPAWARAWPSIRDSNIATVIICAILYWFGSAFGASIVQGFAVTLFIGVLISLFCALVVTRNFLLAAVAWIQGLDERPAWFGV
jgi:preprotein translocase subunit SecD